MYKTLVLLSIIYFTSLGVLAFTVDIIADVNGQPISNLDVERRLNLMSVLFGDNYANQAGMKGQVLRELIDEITISNESKRLNLKASDEEVKDAITLFFTQNLGLSTDKVDQYIKEHDLSNQFRSKLLFNKIIEMRVLPFIHVSQQEVDNEKKQIEKSDCIIKLQTIAVSSHNVKDAHGMMQNFAQKLRSGVLDTTYESLAQEFKLGHENYELCDEVHHCGDDEGDIWLSHRIVSLNKHKKAWKGVEFIDVFKKLKVGEVSDPLPRGDGYIIVKVIDKIELNSKLFNSTLKLKQAIVKDQKDPLKTLKKQGVSCTNFAELVLRNFNLSDVKEFNIKMKDLSPDLQILLGRAVVGDIIEIEKDGTLRLMILCDIIANEVSTEQIKQHIYQQKVVKQIGILLDEMRNSAAIILLKPNLKDYMQYTENGT